MTIDNAVNKLIESERFKEDCKTDARLRVFLHRLRQGTAKREMIISILNKYGYKVEMNVVRPAKQQP